MSVFNEKYWTSRYQNGLTQWDAGNITVPLQHYFAQLTSPSLKILIPGAGNGYEAEYLHHRGFQEVYLLDFSTIPLQAFQQRVPDFPAEHLLQQDFFDIKLKGEFDLIVEQTFFCSLHPHQRTLYAEKCFELLKPGGLLVGVFFDELPERDQPPFGGTTEEYRQYFEPLFNIVKLERCYNSIKPRAGRELWIVLEKPVKKI